jgi:predicted enzyme related to lactoylglutathione lyase
MTSIPCVCMVLFVNDVARMTAFYSAIAAMQILHEESSYAILKIDGFELVIHAMYGEASPQASPSTIVTVREDSYTKLCLPVANIAVARAKAGELGGNIKSIEHEWVARGIRACDGHDPEGNVLQVRMCES